MSMNGRSAPQKKILLFAPLRLCVRLFFFQRSRAHHWQVEALFAGAGSISFDGDQWVLRSRGQDEALAAGARAFITKPIDERKLHAVLQHIFTGAALRVDGDDTEETGSDQFSAAALLRLPDPTAALHGLSESIGRDWVLGGGDWRKDRTQAVAAIHRLRAQVLLVRAFETAAALARFERALSAGATDEEIAVHAARGDAMIAELLRTIAGEVRALAARDPSGSAHS
jgi:CheY-like chemotaxis protein